MITDTQSSISIYLYVLPILFIQYIHIYSFSNTSSIPCIYLSPLNTVIFFCHFYSVQRNYDVYTQIVHIYIFCYILLISLQFYLKIVLLYSFSLSYFFIFYVQRCYCNWCSDLQCSSNTIHCNMYHCSWSIPVSSSPCLYAAMLPLSNSDTFW